MTRAAVPPPEVGSAEPITLRPYQAKAVEAVYDHLRRRDDNPCIVCPTGAGKSVLIAQICRDAVTRWDGRVLILAHVKELLEQAAEKLRAVCPEVWFGIYSAGLRRRDTDHPVIVAGIQSVYRRACQIGPVDLVIVDEAHLIAPDGDGMYRQLLAEMKQINPAVRVIGLTATPFRLKSGPICTDEGYLNAVCYEIGIRELIRDGYLCPLRSRAGKQKVDFGGLHTSGGRGGEFIAGEVERLMGGAALVRAACEEIVEQAADRRAVLIFAAGLNHARQIATVLEREHGVECGFVEGDTPPLQRACLLDRFREGALKYLVNVNVLTTGFDAPNIDCIALLRPTNSPGLYAQMLGRGFRTHPGKSDCLVLDYGGNILRHGPVDALQIESAGQGDGEAPAKECPKCQALVHAGYATCPECGHAFPPPDREQHEAKASTAGVLSGQVTETGYEVQEVFYGVHRKRGAPEDHPRTLRVEYRCGLNDYHREWLCPEHPRNGYARGKFETWWRARSHEPPPDTAEQAVELAEAGALAEPHAITVRSVAGEPFDRITDYQLGPIPPRLDGSDEREHAEMPDYQFADDDLPF